MTINNFALQKFGVLLVKPPKDLSSAAKKLWVEMTDAWEIEEPASFMLLGELCASFDRLQAAKALLAAVGARSRG